MAQAETEEAAMPKAKTTQGRIEPGERLIAYVKVGRLKRALPHRTAQELGVEIDAGTPVTMSIPDCGKLLLGIGKELAYAVSYPIND
jgi:hypothetical protein